MKASVGKPYWNCGKWSHSHDQEEYAQPDEYGVVYGPCRYVAKNWHSAYMELIAEVERLRTANDELKEMQASLLACIEATPNDDAARKN